MPVANWIITIKDAGAGAPATFDPPNLAARGGDVVNWDNTTDDTHRLAVRDQTGTWRPIPISDIAPKDQSDAWTLPVKDTLTTGTLTITYGCLLHEDAGTLTETGTITI